MNLFIADPCPVPEKLTGEKKSYRVANFRLAVERVFDFLHDIYPDNSSRIKYIGNLLAGDARDWWDNLVVSNTEEAIAIQGDLESFWSHLEKHYGTLVMPFEKEVNLIRFNQGELGIRDFNLKFKVLASKVNFNEEALCAVYIANLNPPTLDFLKKSPPIPKTLQNLMERCGHLMPVSWVINLPNPSLSYQGKC